jgi:hypothetical protein
MSCLLNLFRFPEDIFSFPDDSGPRAMSDLFEGHCRRLSSDFKATKSWKEGAAIAIYHNIAWRHSKSGEIENCTALANSIREYCYLQALFGRVLTELEKRELSPELPPFKKLAQKLSCRHYNPVEVREDGKVIVSETFGIKLTYRWNSRADRFDLEPDSDLAK